MPKMVNAVKQMFIKCVEHKIMCAFRWFQTLGNIAISISRPPSL